jgi:ubiquinone biosynthesis protein
MRSIRSFLALARAGFVLAREGVIAGLPNEPLPPSSRIVKRIADRLARGGTHSEDRSRRLTRALNRLGPSWVKLGQFLATRPDVVGFELAGDLAGLQDRMQPFDRASAVMLISNSLGIPAARLFRDISEPVAAASVAQVHRAVRRRDGAVVAVKVIRPGVRARFRADLDAFYAAARFQEKYLPSSRRLRPVAVVDTLAQSAKIEMDLRLEAAAFSELAENIAGDTGFRVPAVDWQLTGRDCLTMEWVDGVKLSNVEAIRAAGHDPRRLAAGVVQHFLRHTLRDGFFHADMHPGNLFVDRAGDIVAVDLGIMGRLGRKERRFLAEILYGFIRRDYLRVAEVHFEAGYVPRHHNVDSFAQAIRAIGEPIHGQPAQTISMARLLALLFEVTELFEMQTRTELILLQKTMVVVEGVARTLDPDFDMWKTAEPVVGDWIRHHLGPAGVLDDACEGLAALRYVARALPDLASSTEKLGVEIAAAAEHGLRLDPATAEAIGRAQARHSRSGRWALIVIALIASIVAAKLVFWQ